MTYFRKLENQIAHFFWFHAQLSWALLGKKLKVQILFYYMYTISNKKAKFNDINNLVSTTGRSLFLPSNYTACNGQKD